MESCICAFTHVLGWLKFYQSILSLPLQSGDPFFPHVDEIVFLISSGTKTNQQNFMETVNVLVGRCNIVPGNATGEALGNFTIQCFKRGSGQYIFLTRLRWWPLHIFNLWGKWGSGDDVNTIIRYFLEETWKYAESYTHYLFHRGNDIEFKSNMESVDDVQRDIMDLKLAVQPGFKNFEQRVMAKLELKQIFY